MSKTILAACAMSAAVMTMSAYAAEQVIVPRTQGQGGATAIGPAKPTALQLANPNYHPPAKRMHPAEAYYATIKPEGETPKMADGHPDLTGMWTAGFPSTGQGFRTRRSNQSSESDDNAFNRSYRFNKPFYKPELWSKVWASDFSKWDVDPAINCGDEGIPRAMARPSIMMNPKHAWMKVGEYLRDIPLDGRERHEDDADQNTLTGIPLGHWDGDTLVVESVGFDDRTWIDIWGWFHSDTMKLTERFTRKGNLLYYQYVWDDPEVLETPFTSTEEIFKLNPNPAAILGPTNGCNKLLDTDEGIYDVYLRG